MVCKSYAGELAIGEVIDGICRSPVLMYTQVLTSDSSPPLAGFNTITPGNDEVVVGHTHTRLCTETWHVPSDWTVADVGCDLGRLVELTRHTFQWSWVTAPECIGNRHGGDCMHRWSLKTFVGVQPISERGFETRITDQG